MVRAFRDTWELGIHSYLTYLRDRLLLARELLHESGSVFIQISDLNLHYVRAVIEEVFGEKNFCGMVAFSKTTSTSTDTLPAVADFLLWYARDAAKLKFRKLFSNLELEEAVSGEFKFVELPNRSTRSLTAKERANPRNLDPSGKLFRTNTAVPPERSATLTVEIDFGAGYKKHPGENRHWKTSVEGMLNLRDRGRLVLENSPTRMFKRYLDDFRLKEISNIWTDTRSEQNQVYVVQTVTNVLQRCIVMTTDPGDVVFDPTCGSGTTAFVAEQWGRRWITCDTSRVATTLAKQRLMSATFDYYKLAHPNEGVGSGFEYKKVPHVTLKSIANNEPPGEETLYDQPVVDNSRARVSGPFTVEAVPAPNVKSIDEISDGGGGLLGASGGDASEERAGGTPAGRGRGMEEADASVARSGPTLRQSDWRDELLKTGIRGKSGQMINFSRVEPMGGTRWLHADAETKGAKPERVVISFGPDFAPLESRQVEMAWEEARTLHPKPDLIVFASFEFDPEAAKDIDELTKEKTGMTFLTAKMNADLLTSDLKKKRSSNQSFWLVGRPDVEVRLAEGSRRDAGGTGKKSGVRFGGDAGRLYVAEVRGFDYFDTRTGTIESGDSSKIAMWLLDTDYDGRSLYPRQVFFPMADDDQGWAKLARNLKAEIDPELIEAYRGTVSLPFEAGGHRRVAVKVIDDRGIESLRVLQL